MGTGKTRLAQRETTSAAPALRPVLDLHDDIMVRPLVPRLEPKRLLVSDLLVPVDAITRIQGRALGSATGTSEVAESRVTKRLGSEKEPSFRSGSSVSAGGENDP